MLTILFLAVILLIFAIKSHEYRQTEYYEQTKTPYLSLWQDKGRLGEYHIYRNLKAVAGRKYFLFNCLVPKGNGETTEIDVIMLHESGIYVFESKNYSGWIFGTETHQYWTQTLPAGKGHSEKNQFYNPILQNRGHIKWLQEYLSDHSLSFYSFIVFSNRCTLKDIVLTSGNHHVIRREDILRAVLANIKNMGKSLSQEHMDALYNNLYPLTQTGAEEIKKHIDSVQEKQVAVNPVLKLENIPSQSLKSCPYCGKKLVIRTAKKGANKGNKFWGCSNYPQCRYTENIK